MLTKEEYEQGIVLLREFKDFVHERENVPLIDTFRSLTGIDGDVVESTLGEAGEILGSPRLPTFIPIEETLRGTALVLFGAWLASRKREEAA